MTNNIFKKGGLIRNKKDIWVRIPAGLIVIALFAASPLLVALAATWLDEWLSGAPCSPGNCGWAALGMMLPASVLYAAMVLVWFVIKVVWDIVLIIKNQPPR